MAFRYIPVIGWKFKTVRLFRLKIPIMTFVEKNDFDRISDSLQTGVAIVVSNFGKKIF